MAAERFTTLRMYLYLLIKSIIQTVHWLTKHCRCDNMEQNGKNFAMMPYPTDHVTCTCNTNKPSNVRCKWKKVKNSIVRCVRADKEKFQNEDPAFYDDMYDDSAY